MVVEMAADPVVDADLGDIAKFLTLSFGGSESHYRQLFSYWWENNPSWKDGLPKGWAIKSQDGDIIALTANIPFAYVINGQAGKCFVTGYTCVDENWRGHRLSKKIGSAFLAQDDADLLIGTDSTPPAYKLWLGLGMRPLKRNWREKSCRVLGNADHLLDARGSHSRALGPTLGGLGRAVIALAKMSSPVLSRALTARKISSFDVPGAARIESFRAEQSPTTYAVRDREALDWMYFGCDYVRENRAVFAAFDGGSIVGYLAVKRIMNSFYLLECRCENADPEIARVLIWAARDHAETLGISFINVWRYAPMIADAIPTMCATTYKSIHMMTYCYRSNRGPIDEDKWESTPGDGDLSVN
ncbi:MAG: hypothetical protein WBQ53_00520 [Methylocystis sp.]